MLGAVRACVPVNSECSAAVSTKGVRFLGQGDGEGRWERGKDKCAPLRSFLPIHMCA